MGVVDDFRTFFITECPESPLLEDIEKMVAQIQL